MHTATVVPSLLSKSDLRLKALADRRIFARALSSALRGDLEKQLVDRVMPHLAPGCKVAGYYPMKEEIDPLPILAAAAEIGCTVALPWFSARNASMIFREGPAVDTGPWKVPQPSGSATAVAPDVVLVPLVAADRRCNRIGHGKGHYDRALANLRESARVRTIGLAWDVQILDGIIPADPWDIPLDAIATPGDWIEGPTS